MIDHDAEGTDCCGKGISDLIRHSKKGSRGTLKKTERRHITVQISNS